MADVLNPTDFEWSNYWLKNPTNALTGGNTSSEKAWFKISSDSLVLDLNVPDELGSDFDSMLAEIVEYRLHRYLVGREAKRIGDRRRPSSDTGRLIDAAFTVESVLGQPISVLFESAGGAGSDGKKRNPDYVEGVDVVLARLKELGATILDAYVDSERTRDLPIPDRRLQPGSEYPVDLRSIADVQSVRRSLLNGMAKVGQAPEAKGGGNQRKAMRLLLGRIEHFDSSTIAEVLADVRPIPKPTIDSSSAPTTPLTTEASL